MSEQEQLLHRGLFARLTRVGFIASLNRNLARNRRWSATTIQGRPVPELLFIARGTAKVMVGADEIALVQMGSFIGEMSFMTGGNACVNARWRGWVRLFAIAKSALDALLNRDHEIETAILRVIGQDLTLKLRTQTLSD